MEILQTILISSLSVICFLIFLKKSFRSLWSVTSFYRNMWIFWSNCYDCIFFLIIKYPTRAICPILLSDFRKIIEKKDDKLFTEQDIKNCMKKVTPINLHQTLYISDLEIKCYYAGHVIGAALFFVKDLKTGQSTVYTGDFNNAPDRHLGRTSIEKLNPDI